MNKIVFCLIVSLLLSVNGFSQKNIEPTEDDKKNAKLLKQTYFDDSIVLQESEDFITFNYNKKEGKVIVNQESNESMINIDSRSTIQKYSFYDEQSVINKFEIKHKNDKSTRFDIKDETYNNNDLFHHDARVKYATINFPLLGYKFKTSITKEYLDIKYFTKIYFNDDYPTLKKAITFEVPNWLELELKEVNFEGYSIKKNITNNQKNDSKTYVYTLENIPAFYKEPSAPGPTYIYPHILILAKSYTFNNKKENIFNSTQDLYNWYKSLVNTLENDNSSISEKVKLLTENAKTDEEKIKNIYYWVQDNIRYIAFEDGIAGYKPDEASNVFNKKYGDCKGMANLIKQMLIEAGFDARLTWIGTKRIAYNYSTPNLSVDNHMICSLIKDEKIIFLDGTEKFNAFGEYANRIQGKQVLIENGDDFILETVPEVTSDFNKEIFNYSLTLNDDILEGKGTKNFNGESRTSLLYHFDSLRNDKKNEFLEAYLNNKNTNIKVTDIKTTDLLNRELSLDITYNLSIKNAVTSFNKDVYIDIDFDKELEKFLLEKRKTDYIFDFKRFLETTTTLKIPSGYSVTQIPENLSISSKNYDIVINFSSANNVITYKKIFKLKNAKIETSDFKEWNAFISKLKSVYNEQIILTEQ